MLLCCVVIHAGMPTHLLAAKLRQSAINKRSPWKATEYEMARCVKEETRLLNLHCTWTQMLIAQVPFC